MDVRTILEDTLFHLKYIRLPNLGLFYVGHPVCFRRDSCNSTHQDNLDYLFISDSGTIILVYAVLHEFVLYGCEVG